MTNKQRIDTDLKEEHWKELKSRLKQIDKSRNHSKRHYGRLGLKIGLMALRERQGKLQELEEQKQEVMRDVIEVANDGLDEDKRGKDLEDIFQV